MSESESLAVNNPLLPPLLDAVRLFNELQIPYALIGGMAAMIYGRARFTDDVDFAAASQHERAFAQHPDVMQSCNFDPACTWKLYHSSGVEIDISKDAYTDGIAARAREVKLRTHSVRVADIHDLIAMKLRAGRLQDDYDIGEMVRAGNLDARGSRGWSLPMNWLASIRFKSAHDECREFHFMHIRHHRSSHLEPRL